MLFETFKINQRFLFASFFVGLVFIFLFNIGQAKANFSTCGITPTSPLWQAKVQDGTVVMTVDSAGNLDIVATTVQTNTAPPAGGLTNSLIIKNSAANKFVFNKTNAYIAGSILENQVSLPAANGDDLVVKNSAGTAVALFDATTGNIYLKARSCGAIVNCTLPWGGTIANGSSVTAYAASSVPCGSSCSSQIRTCTNGVLSGTYTNRTCSVAVCRRCTLPWGVTIAHGSSVTAYLTSCGSSCSSQTRTCNDGVLSGTYTNRTCKADCSCTLPWGGTIANGSSVTAYYAGSVPCGSTCSNQTRTCTNGILSGTYTKQACSVASCCVPSCTGKICGIDSDGCGGICSSGSGCCVRTYSRYALPNYADYQFGYSCVRFNRIGPIGYNSQYDLYVDSYWKVASWTGTCIPNPDLVNSITPVYYWPTGDIQAFLWSGMYTYQCP